MESSAKAERRFLKALCKKIEFDRSDDTKTIHSKLEQAISSLPESEFRNNLLKHLPQHAEKLLATHLEQSTAGAKGAKKAKKAKVSRSFNICTEARGIESLELAQKDAGFRSKLFASIFLPSQCMVDLVDESSVASDDPLVLLRRHLQCFQLDANGCASPGGLAVHLDRVVEQVAQLWEQVTSVPEKKQGSPYFSQLKEILNLTQHFLLQYSIRQRIGENTTVMQSAFPTQLQANEGGTSTMADLVSYFVLFTALHSVQADKDSVRLVSTSISFILFFIREMPIQSLYSVVMRFDELPANKVHSYLPVFEQVFLNRPLPVVEELDASQYFRYLQLTRKLGAFFTENPSTDTSKRSKLRELVAHASMAPMPPSLFSWFMQTLDTSSLKLSAELRSASRHTVSRLLMKAKLVSDEQLQTLVELVVQSFGASAEEETSAVGDAQAADSAPQDDGPLFFIDQKGGAGKAGKAKDEQSDSSAGKDGAQKRKRGSEREAEEALEQQIASSVALMQEEDDGDEDGDEEEGEGAEADSGDTRTSRGSQDSTKRGESVKKGKRGTKRKGDEEGNEGDQDTAKTETKAKPTLKTPAKAKSAKAKAAKSESKKAEKTPKGKGESKKAATSVKKAAKTPKAKSGGKKAATSIKKAKKTASGDPSPRRTRSNSVETKA
jgi:hypothetical protein